MVGHLDGVAVHVRDGSGALEQFVEPYHPHLRRRDLGSVFFTTLRLAPDFARRARRSVASANVRPGSRRKLVDVRSLQLRVSFQPAATLSVLAYFLHSS